MISFNADKFLYENKKDFHTKNFLKIQEKELKDIEKSFKILDDSISNLIKPYGVSSNSENDHNNISRETKRDKEIFTLDQCMDPTRYKPSNQNFDVNYEFIFSGCSQTQGEYIACDLNKTEFNNIWGFQIANKYNKKALNLALQGWSIEGIVKGVMNHVRKNGNPKVLFLLLPDFGRLDFIVNHKIKRETENNNTLENIIQQHYINSNTDYIFKEISKYPHYANDVFPYYELIYRGLQAILMLDTYCKSSNIYFKYTSWNLGTNFVLKTLKDSGLEEYNNYIETDFFNWSSYCDENLTLGCHENKINSENKIYWDYGHDKAHIGIHQHIHIAERFIEEIEKDHPWN